MSDSRRRRGGRAHASAYHTVLEHWEGGHGRSPKTSTCSEAPAVFALLAPLSFSRQGSKEKAEAQIEVETAKSLAAALGVAL